MRKKISWSVEKKTLTQQRLSKLLLQEPSIVFAYVFGSYVNQLSFRDLDLAIFLDPAFISDFAAFEQSLGTKLEVSIRAPVDLVLLNVAPLSLRFYATKGQLLLSRDENVRLQFLERTWTQYWDFQPHRRELLWQTLATIP